MSNYSGPERRVNTNMNQDDRDLIIRMDQNLINLIRWTENHANEDSDMFTEIKKDNEFSKKVLYMGIGGLFVLQVALKLFFK